MCVPFFHIVMWKQRLTLFSITFLSVFAFFRLPLFPCCGKKGSLPCDEMGEQNGNYFFYQLIHCFSTIGCYVTVAFSNTYSTAMKFTLQSSAPRYFIHCRLACVILFRIGLYSPRESTARTTKFLQSSLFSRSYSFIGISFTYIFAYLQARLDVMWESRARKPCVRESCVSIIK